MRRVKSFLMQLVAFCLTLPLACLGVLARGVWEGLRLGWNLPELVSTKRAIDNVEHVLRKMDKR